MNSDLSGKNKNTDCVANLFPIQYHPFITTIANSLQTSSMANVNMNVPLPPQGGARNDNIHDRYVHRPTRFENMHVVWNVVLCRPHLSLLNIAVLLLYLPA